ncbi:DUF7007 domain-containing protein [Agromyces sp. NPDC057679]|uniref:DUF7007 domain-containing protein n=1 Tax=Agromyces sp. NPDC057679 TaxID=3346207 RepID=UPI00366B8798
MTHTNRFNEADVNRVSSGHGRMSGTFSEKGQTAADFGGLQVKSWGSVELRAGDSTPYGKAQNVEHVADGIAFASTAGHGAYKLSRERMAAIPAAFRMGSSWFEEDVEWRVVAAYHPDAFPTMDPADSEQQLKDWYPDQWEKANGRELLMGESRKKDEQLWAEAHKDDLVATYRIADPDNDGYVLAPAYHPTEEYDQYGPRFRINADEFRQLRREGGEPGQSLRLVIDPSRHEQVAPVERPVLTQAPRYRSIAPAKTAAAQARIDKDLDRLWRVDGRVRSLRQLIEEEGVTGKSVHVQSGRQIFTMSVQEHVEDSSKISFEVSKATWDAADAPDDRSPYQVALQEHSRAQHAHEKLGKQTPQIGSDAWREHREKLRISKEKVTALSDKINSWGKEPLKPPTD